PAHAGSMLKLSDVLGRRRPKCHPSSRTGENPPYGMIGGIEETSASFEARSAPRSYPTIGVHVGDIMVQGDNLFGDAVNVAARLEALAEPGGICISGAVRDHVGPNLSVGFVDLGPQQVKNITQPIRAYQISGETSSTVSPVGGSSLLLPDKP